MLRSVCGWRNMNEWIMKERKKLFLAHKRLDLIPFLHFLLPSSCLSWFRGCNSKEQRPPPPPFSQDPVLSSYENTCNQARVPTSFLLSSFICFNFQHHFPPSCSSLDKRLHLAVELKSFLSRKYPPQAAGAPRYCWVLKHKIWETGSFF